MIEFCMIFLCFDVSIITQKRIKVQNQPTILSVAKSHTSENCEPTRPKTLKILTFEFRDARLFARPLERIVMPACRLER